MWAAHKLRLARREGRDPVKRSRDLLQAHGVKRLIEERLLQFDLGPAFLETLTASLRRVWDETFTVGPTVRLPNW